MVYRRSLLKTMGGAIATLLLIWGCQANAPETLETTPEATQTSDFKVAMLLPGSREDGSWSQGGYEGLRKIEAEYQAHVDYQEYVEEDNSAEMFREYAEAGYDLIIGHSGGYIESLETVAEEFPRTKFAVVTTYSGNNKNLGAVAFRSSEVGYLSGVLATFTTKSQKVGYLVGYDYPVYQEEEALFRRGVLESNPDIEPVTVFLQTWTDGDVAIDAVNEMLAKDVDVFVINADEAGIFAIKELTKHPEVSIIGWTKDQHELAPNQMITSVMQDIPGLILNIATLTQQGRWEGKLYKFGLKENIYQFAPFRGSLTPEQEAEFNQLKEKVMSGAIDTTP
ncbi:BMP family protein [Spirulina sp. CCNP1310]|uniref:BMP family protein n=1 Tax=Spirulina sp. CCNP1310 TaxID=3110249 RepID=UPI002B1F5071|nr:BMP family protein [Spirulina sp. CCNP1310]MEA5418760.1 BMP family protein [Spirulina sp. CCNP1310]